MHAFLGLLPFFLASILPYMAQIRLIFLGFSFVQQALFIFKSGYKSRKVLQRLERLEMHDEMQRKDIEVLVIANFAILDGLKQQGCNGKVTKAHEGLQEHITKNRYTI